MSAEQNRITPLLTFSGGAQRSWLRSREGGERARDRQGRERERGGGGARGRVCHLTVMMATNNLLCTMLQSVAAGHRAF